MDPLLAILSWIIPILVVLIFATLPVETMVAHSSKEGDEDPVIQFLKLFRVVAGGLVVFGTMMLITLMFL